MSQSARPPFDAFADDYDRRFSHTTAATWLRASVRERLGPHLRPGMSVLELGCGTGEDAIWLQRNGCRVLATDQSPARLKKLGDKQGGGEIRTAVFDMASGTGQDLPTGFRADLVFSNFGAVNCVADLAPVFALARSLLARDGLVAFTAMGRFCLWETLWFGCRGRFRTAGRRWSGKARYAAGSDVHDVFYHRPSDMQSAAAGFERIALFGIGSLLPTSEAFGLVERWPRTFERIARADRAIAGWTAGFSDHYLMILRKSAA